MRTLVGSSTLLLLRLAVADVAGKSLPPPHRRGAAAAGGWWLGPGG